MSENQEDTPAAKGEEENAEGGQEDQAKAASKPPSRASSEASMQSGISAKKGMDEIVPDENAQDNKAGDWRNMRRIIAEDPEWSLATVPLLNELVVKHIVNNFESEYSIKYSNYII